MKQQNLWELVYIEIKSIMKVAFKMGLMKLKGSNVLTLYRRGKCSHLYICRSS